MLFRSSRGVRGKRRNGERISEQQMNGKTHNVHHMYTMRTPITNLSFGTLTVQSTVHHPYSQPYTLIKVLYKGTIQRNFIKVLYTCCRKINFAAHSLFFQLRNLFKGFKRFGFVAVLNCQASGEGSVIPLRGLLAVTPLHYNILSGLSFNLLRLKIGRAHV